MTRKRLLDAVTVVNIYAAECFYEQIKNAHMHGWNDPQAEGGVILTWKQNYFGNNKRITLARKDY